MRQGSLPTTSQANPEEAAAVFEKIINEQNADILHIAFSSGLSGSYNSARLAAEELSEKYPDRKIIVIDSLCASLGEGLLVHKAVTLKEQGHTCLLYTSGAVQVCRTRTGTGGCIPCKRCKSGIGEESGRTCLLYTSGGFALGDAERGCDGDEQ